MQDRRRFHRTWCSNAAAASGWGRSARGPNLRRACFPDLRSPPPAPAVYGRLILTVRRSRIRPQHVSKVQRTIDACTSGAWTDHVSFFSPIKHTK